MRFETIKTIFIKDWKELWKSKQAVLPMILVPLILVILLPTVFTLTSSNINLSNAQSSNEEFIRRFPPNLLPDNLNQDQKLIYIMLVYFFSPFFLLIPIMVSSIIASNSFAGEKEQKTIEGLLYTPITDKELIFAKILVALIPAVIVSWISFIVYGILVNALGFNSFHYIFFPTPAWILMIIWLVPAISFLSLSLIIMVSQKASGVWEAQQISGLLVIPVVSLLLSQAAGLVYLRPMIIILAGIIFYVIDYFIYLWLIKSFDRERIVTKFA